MDSIAIHVDGISKQYHFGARGGGGYDRLSEALVALPRMLWRASKQVLARSERTSETTELQSKFWALRDVSFEVARGEVCGIVGRNGAGKSTLLKILSRITEPTCGRFGLDGRVTSLLEVGTGFHTELTGRENIYLSGVTLGMTRAEVARHFDEIVEFSGIDRFLDTPIKHYSSGMQVRLGFSVAAHLQSEILIIDEVLAVGDVSFQKKCLGKLRDVAQSGRTALFVSHNLVAVQNLCRSAVLLDEGRMVMKGSPEQVIAEYMQSFRSADAKESSWQVSAGGIKRIFDCIATGELCLGSSTMTTESRWHEAYSIDASVVIHLSVEVDSSEKDETYKLVFHYYFDDGTLAFATASPAETASSNTSTVHTWACHIPPKVLNEGHYMLEILVLSGDFQILGRFPEVMRFEMRDEKPRHGWYGKWVGVVRPDCEWTTPSRSHSLSKPGV